jgi:hypothetical protein
MSYSPEGVGLKLEGFPTDVRKFYRILAQESCHPKAAHRILNRINQNGYDKLTVMSRLNFDWVETQLAHIGVVMTFIAPLKNWKAKYEDGPWKESDLPTRMRRV